MLFCRSLYNENMLKISRHKPLRSVLQLKAQRFHVQLDENLGGTLLCFFTTFIVRSKFLLTVILDIL